MNRRVNTPSIAPDAQPLGLEWNDLSVILAIGRGGSLSAAARALGQTHSTVFRKINGIEEKTGVRFFDRFSSGYTPTQAGEAAITTAERVEGEVRALSLEVVGRDTALRGRIRLTSMETFANEIAPAVIARFSAAHPEIFVDLTPGAGQLDLSKREAEVAVRATPKPPETSFGRKICDFRFAIYGAPAYLAGREPDAPLADARWCMIEGALKWLVPLIWPTLELAEARAFFQCSSSRAVQNAARAGMGLTMLPCYAGDADPELLRVTAPIDALKMELWVLTHPDLQKTARVRALMAHLYDELGTDADLYAGDRPQPGALEQTLG